MDIIRFAHPEALEAKNLGMGSQSQLIFSVGSGKLSYREVSIQLLSINKKFVF